MRMLTQGLLESDNSKVPDVITFYTGLPSYSRLKAVFDFVSASVTALLYPFSISGCSNEAPFECCRPGSSLSFWHQPIS